jgi:hypothetical protein
MEVEARGNEIVIKAWDSEICLLKAEAMALAASIVEALGKLEAPGLSVKVDEKIQTTSHMGG